MIKAITYQNEHSVPQILQPLAFDWITVLILHNSDNFMLFLDNINKNFALYSWCNDVKKDHQHTPFTF